MESKIQLKGTYLRIRNRLTDKKDRLMVPNGVWVGEGSTGGFSLQMRTVIYRRDK